jgi:tyrosine-protein kinase Etk/Wzc
MFEDSQSTLMTNSRTVNNSQVEGGSFDFKKVFLKIVHHWLLFVVSILLFLLLSLLYARYSSADWHVYSKIMVDDSKNSSASALGGSSNANLSSLFDVKSNADNELQILKSRSLATSLVKQMRLNMRMYSIREFQKVEVYDEFPYNVNVDYKTDTLQQQTYLIEPLSSNTYRISNKTEKVSIQASYGQKVNLPQYTVSLSPLNPSKKITASYYIYIESVDAAIANFSKSFSAALSDKQATAIDISINYPNPKKGEAILNEFMNLYLLKNLQKKVLIADSTMKFINERIAVVGNELNNVEQKFEQYKQKNNIANITEQSKALVTSSSEYYDKLNQQQIQLSIINDLESYLNDPKNKKIIPSSLTLQSDNSFGQSVNAYNELLISRDKAELSYTADHPVVLNLDIQINNARLNLLKNIETYKKSLRIIISQLKQQNGNLNGQLGQLPAKERFYLDLSRQQNLKQELYLYLLQKREETAISKTSTISSSTIIDYAKSDFNPYKPNRPLIYLIGVVLGIIVPSLYLITKEALSIKIIAKADILNGTKASIIGEITHSTEGKNLVSGANSRSILAEHFRSLRTNLKFVLDTSKTNVLLFTSSMGGEGKSFLSLNLGSSLALTGKKVVFLELDLRKPKLSESIGLNNAYGFTNYAVSSSADADLSQLLKPTGFDDNCFIIPSGPIPPNPTELLSSEKLHILIEQLKKQFDYIIIDCAPIGLVTDALILSSYADLTLYVIRQNYTYNSQLNIINDLMANNKVKNIYLIVNDINMKSEDYLGYVQSQGYGDYIKKDKENASIWSKLFKRT